MGNRLPDPITLFAAGAVLVMLLSHVGERAGWSVDKPVALPLTEQVLDSGTGAPVEAIGTRVAGRRVCVVLTVVGGQGFVLGRGNQQISPAVLRAAGMPRIDVICGAGKLAGLTPQELTIDTGDVALDAALAGYWPVITGPGRRQVMRVVA